MKNLLLPIAMGLLCSSFTVIPPDAETGSKTVAAVPSATGVQPETTSSEAIYNTIQLSQYGLSKEAFDYALKGYNYLQQSNRLKRNSFLTICDFSQSSKNKRLYIIDLEKQELVINTWVAHGKNSGGEFAKSFSNTEESLQSSLGFYTTAETYIGKHGLSLRLNGMEPGVNDRAYKRTIVIHGAAYVDRSRLSAGMYMGRSWGCPAVPQNESSNIINTIKNGTCFFIYHPSRNYLLNSKLLNHGDAAEVHQEVND